MSDRIPRNAVGDKAPRRILTKMATPVSRNGTEKSISLARCELIFRDVAHISAFLSTKSLIRPFQPPAYKQ